MGKSTLLGMIARRAEADVNVIALLGERGREVRDFLENALGAEGLARSVVIVATGDQAAHDAYQEHPRHVRFVEENKPTWAKVLVFDSYSLAWNILNVLSNQWFC